MQKKLLTVAVASALALPAIALAQVTVYGTIDPGVRSQGKVCTPAGTAGTCAATDSQLRMDSGYRTTDRWGLKGSEDLGNGLMANFTLEGAYNSDTGFGPNATGSSAGLFGRKSIVGLSKGGNSVDWGHDYTVDFKTAGIFDPMGYTYTGIAPTATQNVRGTRNSNMITGGFRFGTGGVRVEYVMGEAVGSAVASGDAFGVGGDFAFGPVTIAASFSTAENAVNVDTTTMNIGGKYAMGALTFRAGYSKQEVDAGNDTPMFMLGVQYKISPTMDLRGGYYNLKSEVGATGVENGTKKLFIVGLDFALSKRTTAYVEFDRYNLTGSYINAATGVGAGLADGATGIGAGVVHAF